MGCRDDWEQGALKSQEKKSWANDWAGVFTDTHHTNIAAPTQLEKNAGQKIIKFLKSDDVIASTDLRASRLILKQREKNLRDGKSFT